MYTDLFERVRNRDGLTRRRYPRLYSVLKYTVATALVGWALASILMTKAAI